jgi:hypothetical protein
MPETATLPVAAARPEVNRHQMKSRFYVGAAVFVILLNMAGFLPSLIDQSRRVAPPTWLMTAHGALAAAWLLFFLVQTTLVASRRTPIHRRVGVAGPFIAFAMIAVGSMTVIDLSRRGYDLSGDLARAAGSAPGSPPLAREEFVATMLPPLLGFANFGILTGLGLAFRHRPAVHKRLMLLALGPLVVTPLIHLSGHVIGRWPGLYGPFLNLAVLITANALPFVVAAHDKVSDGRVHPISVWVPVLLIVETFGLIAVVMPSDGWRRLALWLVS